MAVLLQFRENRQALLLILIIACDSRQETAPRIEGVVWNTSAVEDLRQAAQFKAKTRASHNAGPRKISLSQAGTSLHSWSLKPMVRIGEANAVNPSVSDTFDKIGVGNGVWSSGVVMDSSDSNGGGEARDFEQAVSEPLSAPHVAGRMKHLLFGVRLSAGLPILPPATDLEQLANELDAMRTKRILKLRAHSRGSR